MYRLKIKNRKEKERRTEYINESLEKKGQREWGGVNCSVAVSMDVQREKKTAHTYVKERNKIQTCMHVEKKSILYVHVVSEQLHKEK